MYPQTRKRFPGLSRLFFCTSLYIRCKYISMPLMELTLQLKLLPTDEQATALRATMARFNEACNWLASQAFAKQCSNKLTLQRLYYHELRIRFALPSHTNRIK